MQKNYQKKKNPLSIIIDPKIEKNYLFDKIRCVTLLNISDEINEEIIEKKMEFSQLKKNKKNSKIEKKMKSSEKKEKPDEIEKNNKNYDFEEYKNFSSESYNLKKKNSNLSNQPKNLRKNQNFSKLKKRKNYLEIQQNLKSEKIYSDYEFDLYSENFKKNNPLNKNYFEENNFTKIDKENLDLNILLKKSLKKTDENFSDFEKNTFDEKLFQLKKKNIGDQFSHIENNKNYSSSSIFLASDNDSDFKKGKKKSKFLDIKKMENYNQKNLINSESKKSEKKKIEKNLKRKNKKSTKNQKLKKHLLKAETKNKLLNFDSEESLLNVESFIEQKRKKILNFEKKLSNLKCVRSLRNFEKDNLTNLDSEKILSIFEEDNLSNLENEKKTLLNVEKKNTLLNFQKKNSKLNFSSEQILSNSEKEKILSNSEKERNLSNSEKERNLSNSEKERNLLKIEKKNKISNLQSVENISFEKKIKKKKKMIKYLDNCIESVEILDQLIIENDCLNLNFEKIKKKSEERKNFLVNLENLFFYQNSSHFSSSDFWKNTFSKKFGKSEKNFSENKIIDLKTKKNSDFFVSE